MRLWHVLCGVLVYLSAGLVSAMEVGHLQAAIMDAILKTNGTFCLKSAVTGGVGVCVYIHKHQATYDEAQYACSLSGGYLPEDQRDDSATFSLERQMERQVSMVTTALRYPDGTWLGGRMLPSQDPTWYDVDGVCNPPSSPPPPACAQQQDTQCGMAYVDKNKTKSFRCSCFQPRPYMCVTSRDKSTNYCPNGFSACAASPFCYKPGGPASNWFTANQQCSSIGGELPDTTQSQNMTALMECAGLDNIWTSYTGARWSWRSTGGLINNTNWQADQPPACAPMGCLQMGRTGEWSAVDCQLRSNFMCINKRNQSCEGCEVFTYADSSRDLDDQSVGINSNPGSDKRARRLPSRQALSTCQEVVIGVVIALAAVVVIFIILLFLLLRQNRRYKENLVSLTEGSQLNMKPAGGTGSATHNKSYVGED